jgi:hypothetical protein
MLRHVAVRAGRRLVLAGVLAARSVQAADVAFDNDCNNLLWFATCTGKSNWSNDGLPGPADNATIGAEFAVRTSSGSGTAEIQVRSLNVAGSFLLGGVNLAVQEASQIKDLDLNATLSAARPMDAGAGVTLSGEWIWRNGGNLRGAGTTALFRNSGEGRIEAGPGVLERLLLVNDRLIVHTGWLALKPDAALRNQNLWVLTTNNDDILKFDGNDPDQAVFDNRAVLRNSGGNSTIGVVFISDAPGSVQVQGGRLTFQRPSFFGGPIAIDSGAMVVIQAPQDLTQTFRATVTLSGMGELQLIGGPDHRHRIEGQLVNELAPPGGLLIAGTVDIAGDDATLTNRGALRWRGAVGGRGRFVHTGIMGVIEIEASSRLGTQLLADALVSQAATLTLEDVGFPDAQAIVVGAGREWVIEQTDILIAGAEPRGAMAVRGRLRATGDGLRSRIDTPVDLDTAGSIRVDDLVTLGLSGGGTWFGSAPLDLAGTIELSAPNATAPRLYSVTRTADFRSGPLGTLVLRPHATLAVQRTVTSFVGNVFDRSGGFYVRGGTLDGPGTLINRSRMLVESGRIGRFTRRLTMVNAGAGRLDISGNPVPLNGSLINEGRLSMIPGSVDLLHGAGLALEDEALFDNRGLVNLDGTNAISGNGRILNTGFIVKHVLDAPSGTSTVGVPLDNLGWVSVEKGVLDLAGGVQQVEGQRLIGGTWNIARGAALVIRNAMITTIGPGAEVVIGSNSAGTAFERVSRVEGNLTVLAEFLGNGLQIAPAASAGTSAEEAGTPRGAGTAVGRFALGGGELLNEGTVAPGEPGGIAPFVVEGSYRQAAGGALHLDLGADAGDQLAVSGAAALDGTLTVDLLDGHRPDAGENVVVLSAASISGRFANAAERLQTDGGAFTVTYGQTSVVLSGFDPSILPTGGTRTATATRGTPGPATPTPTGATPSADTPSPTPTPTGGPCAGDCNGNGSVSVSELVLGVNIALGGAELAACAVLDHDRNGAVSVGELIAAVNAALDGCALD